MVDHTIRVHEGDPNRVALILPGSGYTAQGPLLSYANQALRAAGWSTKTLVWAGEPEGLREAATVCSALVRELTASNSGHHLIVAKSLGTLALPVAVELSVPGVWLTPLLSDQDVPEVREAVLRLASSETPALLVGGTADELWDSEVATLSGAQVIEAPEANHSLEVPGDWRSSLAILSRVTEAIADFSAKTEHQRPRWPTPP